MPQQPQTFSDVQPIAGQTFSSVTPIAGAAAAPAEEPGILDREIRLTDHTAATLSGLQSIGRGVRDAVKGTFAMLNPLPQDADEEDLLKQGTVGGAPSPMALPVYRAMRSLGHTAASAKQVIGAIHDINNSADPAGTYAKVAQETSGQGAGQALTAIATEGATRGMGKIADTAATTEGSLGSRVSQTLQKTARDVAQDIPIVRKLAKVKANWESTAPTPDATGENQPYAGEEKPPAAQGSEQPPAQAKPTKVPAKTVRQSKALGPDATARVQSQALGNQAAPAAAAAPEAAPMATPQAAPAPRTIVKDPVTGKPEFSDVISRRQQIAQRLAENMDQIQRQEAAAASEQKTAAPEENLTQQLKDSLAHVQAQKGIPVRTSAAPKDLLDRWGVDEDSFAQGRQQTRGMKPDESSAAIAKLTKAYKNGEPVTPVMETRDAGNNIIDVDGRGRALAAHKAGVERIPIIVRRIGVQ